MFYGHYGSKEYKMAKKQNTVIWIIIALVAIILIGPKLGLFSVQCVSNEPTTLEEYDDVVDATIHYCIIDFGECYYQGCSIGRVEFSINDSFYFVCPFPIFIDGPDIKTQNILEYIKYYDINISNFFIINGIKIYSYENWKFFESKDRMILTNANNPQPYFDTFYVCGEPEKECLFTIQDFCIKLWMILVGIIALLLLFIMLKK